MAARQLLDAKAIAQRRLYNNHKIYNRKEFLPTPAAPSIPFAQPAGESGGSLAPPTALDQQHVVFKSVV
jgi:hypothetical protein